MSVRLFAGYFLALAACATIAFGSSDAETSSSPAAAVFLPGFYHHSSSFSHRHKIVFRRQVANAQ